ncbi:MAG TPA: hypothetical protein VGO18_30040, partial [Steroidobacteraceae bacterium]|nr:hypothetical protein [Steroidobacteraceae bacterium]
MGRPFSKPGLPRSVRETTSTRHFKGTQTVLLCCRTKALRQIGARAGTEAGDFSHFPEGVADASFKSRTM